MAKPPSPATNTLRWQSTTLTHVGKVRSLNEDSSLDRCDIGLWVVADGMGGHSAGDLASQLIVNTLAKIEAQPTLRKFVDVVEDSLLSVNKRVNEIAADQHQTSGSTVVVMLAHGKHCVCIWAGDSRLYRLRDGELTQLTTDHSQVELYVERGLLSREEAVNHPAGNMVTRAVGANDELSLEMDITEMSSGDRFLLCSDGLDKHVTDDEIGLLLGNEGRAEAAQNLIDLTLARGATDNVTIAVVEIR